LKERLFKALLVALLKKATKKCDCTIALFKRTIKKCDRTIALLKWANVQKKCKFSNVQIAQQAGLGNRPFWKCAIALFKEQKSAIWKSHFFCTFTLFERAIMRLLFLKCKNSAIFKFALFSTFSYICSFQKSNCAIPFFQRVTKSAIAHPQIFKERQKVRSHIRTFLKSNKKCNRTFSKSENVRCANVRLPNPAGAGRVRRSKRRVKGQTIKQADFLAAENFKK